MEYTAVIGGTGFDRLDGFHTLSRHRIDTPYGAPSDALQIGMLYGREILFLPRHGADHTLPPHRINYRANIRALQTMGATRIIAFAAVGAIEATMRPGDIVIPHQILDYTWGRKHTFFDGASQQLEHVDFSFPYSEPLRQKILQAAGQRGIQAHKAGVYAVTQGPRLESAAEIDRLERDGGHIVGMTGMPEAALAREAGMEYATIAMVVNPAAGRTDSPITLEMIQENLIRGVRDAASVLQYVQDAAP